MALPAESLIAHTLRKMKASMAEKASREDGRIRSGLLFTGNVHDSYPRRLLLDTRLSPLDKTAWMMIRLHALNNEGAVFPTYDELQLQLASPGRGKASRETVSRVLTMLRLTGWLSLCKRVRDEKGRVRGNIYALHDEPLTCCDAEKFDPRYLDMVLDTVSRSRNKTIRTQPVKCSVISKMSPVCGITTAISLCLNRVWGQHRHLVSWRRVSG